MVAIVVRCSTLLRNARRDEDELNEQLILSSPDDHARKMMDAGIGGSIVMGGLRQCSWCIQPPARPPPANATVLLLAGEIDLHFPAKNEDLPSSRQYDDLPAKMIVDNRRGLSCPATVGNSSNKQQPVKDEWGGYWGIL